MESQQRAQGAADQTADAVASGRPQMVEWGQPPAPQGGGPNLVLMLIAGAALLIATAGMVHSMLTPEDAAAAPAPVASQPSMLSDQREMMHDAMTMAREAQQMQREHMEMVRQQMQQCEGGAGGGYETGQGAESREH